jgi:HEAT repeat protein
MRGITELRHYSAEVVVPLLKRLVSDKEFIVRSFAVMGLGRKQTEEGFEILLDLLEHELDPNVRAEVSNSLARYGDAAIPHLVNLFERDFNWLVRHSILASIDGHSFPEAMLKICSLGIQDYNIEVQLASIISLGVLQGTSQESEALTILLLQVNSDTREIRIEATRVLHCFKDSRARETLLDLRNDPDYKIVAATLEGLI